MYFNPDATDLISQARLTDHEDLDVLDDATVRALAESIQAGTKAKTALRRPGLPSPTRSALSAQVISGNAAKERLVLANLRLVPWVTGRLRLRSRGIDQSDLWQEGVIGLMRAAEKFDPDKGAFSTYATWWIRQAVERAIANKGRLVRQPVHVADARRNSHHPSHGSRTLIDAAARFDTLESIEALAVTAAASNSVEDADNVVELVSRLDAFGPRVDDASDTHALDDQINFLLDGLSDKEQHIVRQRFGLDGDTKTLREIGLFFGVSRERVRQVEKAALEKLRTRYRQTA